MHLSIVIAYEIFSSIDFTLDIRGPHDLYSLKQNQFQTYLVCKHDFVLIPYMLKIWFQDKLQNYHSSSPKNIS